MGAALGSGLHRRQSARPRYYDAPKASLRATAPAAYQLRIFAGGNDIMSSAIGTIGGKATNHLTRRDLAKQIGQRGGSENSPADCSPAE